MHRTIAHAPTAAFPPCLLASFPRSVWPGKKFVDIDHFVPAKKGFSLPPTSTFSLIRMLLCQQFSQGTAPMGLPGGSQPGPLFGNMHWSAEPRAQSHPCLMPHPCCRSSCLGHQGPARKLSFHADSPPAHTYPPADLSSPVPSKALTLQSESSWP